jgi:hypothetical protein
MNLSRAQRILFRQARFDISSVNMSSSNLTPIASHTGKTDEPSILSPRFGVHATDTYIRASRTQLSHSRSHPNLPSAHSSLDFPVSPTADGLGDPDADIPTISIPEDELVWTEERRKLAADLGVETQVFQEMINMMAARGMVARRGVQ